MSRRLKMGKRNALLAIAAVCAVLYGALLVSVAANALWVAAFDGAVQGAIFPLRNPAITPAIAFTTELSDTIPCLIVATAMLAYLLVRRQRRAAGLYVGALVVTYLLVEGTKFALSRPRPIGMNLIEFPWNASFPSGHTFVAVVAVGLAVYVLLKLHPHWPRTARTALATAAVLWVAYIGFTRVYLGVHWPSDVLGSLLLCGGVALPVAALLWPRVVDRSSRNASSEKVG